MKKIRFNVPVKERTNAYLYIVFNPAMPGWIKFGQTTRLNQRLNQLSSSSPVPFVLLYKKKVRRDWALKIESALRKDIGQFDAERLPRNSFQRSQEWVFYNKDHAFNSSRTQAINWIKNNISRSLTLYHGLEKH